MESKQVLFVSEKKKCNRFRTSHVIERIEYFDIAIVLQCELIYFMDVFISRVLGFEPEEMEKFKNKRFSLKLKVKN